MGTELVHIQFGHYLPMNRVVAMLAPTSAPTKRLIQEYESKGLLVDVTNGRARRAVIIMDTGHAILTAITPEAIAARLSNSRPGLANSAGEGS